MPILDLQQRITERGRIRLGTKVTGERRDGSTYTRPSKSRTFLISSQDRTVVDVAAAEWADTAGQVEEFEAGFRVDTGRTELDVILPPEMMSFSQWREMWGNGYCARRCDGQRETISDGPCLCPQDHEERRVLAAKGKACKDTTRLSVMLPDLPGFGLWRVESHGFYAATELAGAVQAVTHLAPNTLVRARLTAVAREVVRFDEKGDPKTHKFVVPTLDLPDVRLRELISPDGGVGVAINAPSRPAGLTPVAPAALTETTGQSIAEQLATTAETPRRKNAAAVLPPTGLRPGQDRAGQSPSREGSSSGGVPATAPEAARPEHAGTAEVVPQQIELGGEGTDGREAKGAAPRPADAESQVTAGADAPPSGPVTLDTLRNALEGIPGMGEGRALKKARDLGEQQGLAHLPQTFDALGEPKWAQLLAALCDALGVAGDGDAYKPLTSAQNRLQHAVWAKAGGEDARKAFISRLTSGRTDSSGELYASEVEALMAKCAELGEEAA